MGDEDDEAQAAGLDRSNASILAEDIAFTARLAPRNRADEDVNMEDDNAGPWQPAQPRNRHRQSARVAAAAATTAAAAASAAAAAAAARESAQAAAASTAASTIAATASQGSSAGQRRTVADSAHAPSSPEDAASAAIAAATRSMQEEDRKRREAANARTKAFAGLMGHVQKMCTDGFVNEAELELFLATSKACHRHGERQSHTRPFPRPMVAMLEEYDPESPTASLQKHGLASQAAVSPPTYGAMAARASRNAPPQLSRAQPDPIQLLKDKCIVGQAKGSAQLAALSGGRRVEKVIARLEEEASARTQDPIDIVDGVNKAMVADGAAAWVRVEVAKHCNTGVAIFPRRGCGVEHLLVHKEAIAEALGSKAVDADEEWDKWVLYAVPTHAGTGVIDEDYLLQKLGDAVGDALRGNVWRLCKRGEDWTKKESTPITFSTTTRANLVEGMPLRMLGRQFILRRHKMRPENAMCGTCGSYKHKKDSCKVERRCRRCAASGHTEDEHEAQCARCKTGSPCVPLCMHCRGPHVAGDRTCRNRPVWSRQARAYVFSTGTELSRLNELGDRSRNKVIRAAQGLASGPNAAPLGPREKLPGSADGDATSQSN
ncbi:hypothetical protein A4X06_0g7725 [Tilletia controversa]|uniref:Uncharacterized protein n=4 Tax=Tilletia TaxID=13289 RepID=A0A8X7STQ4_9BASI|nr:hypothetical protein A4X06_0g7725 [Tilletia controversa]